MLHKFIASIFMKAYTHPLPPLPCSLHDTMLLYVNTRQGLTFSAEDVLEMTRKTRELLPTIPLSVTVPHTLDLDDQVKRQERRDVLKVKRVSQTPIMRRRVHSPAWVIR